MRSVFFCGIGVVLKLIFALIVSEQGRVLLLITVVRLNDDWDEISVFEEN